MRFRKITKNSRPQNFGGFPLTTPIRVENWMRKAAAGLARMKARRDAARQRKQEYYSPTFA
ncbi:hypothetical protein BBN39_004839 [Salmonella enterica subsp. diarizonae serovar 53:z10:z]|nr:hypothetical protein [Salmonella enterica]EDR5596592.1 hypothetical protein [Salmonella enterica subsp. diarizonae]EDU6311739.1 hypothetical protein [Salmonella enterica subsp. diarizonae serovar 53:z10:z]